MFDNWIDMGPLSQAFDLTAPECLELAKRVPCELNPRSPSPKYDLGKIDDHAKRYASKLVENPDQSATCTVMHVALSEWRDSATFQRVWGIYEALWNGKKKEGAYDTLWPVTRIFFLTEWRANKVEAVRFLVKAGYPFQKEVKGLSRAFVDRILAEESAHQQPPASQSEPESLCETPPQEQWQPPGMAPPSHRVYGLEAIAKELGISAKTLSRFMKETDFPFHGKDKRGVFVDDIEAAKAWVDRHREKKAKKMTNNFR